MLDMFSEAFEEPAFWILSGVGYVAFFIMLLVLKGMGQKDVMPLWVKIATMLFIPIAGLIFSKIYSN